ncbi:MAG TPA: glycosyltransferase [Thermoanaerobaculia bacterium]|nr:glycosyltransferase [Thermoanaerobaculia bacterium]
MSKPLISYSLTRHPSQSRIASAYIDALRERYEMVSSQDDADVVIVHHAPRNYETVYALHPALEDSYVISCCVTHADVLPPHWQRNLARVQEIWTCSRYCHQILSRYHPKVTHIPYVAERDFTCSATALEGIRRMIDHDEDNVYFLNIALSNHPRKNVQTLVESFKKVAAAMPKARLVLKGMPQDVPTWSPHPQVLFLPFQMPFEYISALYRLSGVYVSTHRSESWGLTMSDAILCGKPVIATGYSGNLDYMNEDNAFLLSYRESAIPGQALGVELDGATWADPDPASLEERFLYLYETHASEATRQKAERARQEILRFNRPYVTNLIHQSIESALAG